jgi:hypothetical protein
MAEAELGSHGGSRTREKKGPRLGGDELVTHPESKGGDGVAGEGWTEAQFPGEACRPELGKMMRASRVEAPSCD